jgi:hypothetical protein
MDNGKQEPSHGYRPSFMRELKLLKSVLICKCSNFERGKKMKNLMIVLTVVFVFSISAFAQMGTGHGGGMMGDGWGWGMNSGWLFRIIIVILVIAGIVYMMKRR